MTLFDRPPAAGAHAGAGRWRVRGWTLGGVAAVGLLVVGCSSSTDLSDASTTASTTSAESTTASERPTSSAAVPGSSGVDGAGPAGSATAGSGSVAGTRPPASPIGTPFTSVAETTTRKPASTPSAPKPSGTGVIGTLDARSIRWFTAMCTGLSNADTSSAHGAADVSTGDLATRRAQAADVFEKAAAAYRTMSRALSDLSAPRIPAGQKLHDALLEAAPAMAEAAEQGAREVAQSADQAGLTAAIDRAIGEVSTARAPLSDFAEALAAPALAVQLEKIGACRPLFT